MLKYQKGKIYKIVNNDNDLVYYGSTIQLLCNRMAQHRKHLNCLSKNMNLSNSKIILVENYPCNSKEELESRERFYIENNNCINKNKPNRTEEDLKKWFEDNKERIKEQKKIKYNENKEELNKKINCLCGGKYTKQHKNRHLKSNKHKNYLSSLESSSDSS